MPARTSTGETHCAHGSNIKDVAVDSPFAAEISVGSVGWPSVGVWSGGEVAGRYRDDGSPFAHLFGCPWPPPSGWKGSVARISGARRYGHSAARTATTKKAKSRRAALGGGQ